MYKNSEQINSTGTLVLVLCAVTFAFGTVGNLGRFTRGIFFAAKGPSPFRAVSGIAAIVFVIFFMIWHYHNWDLIDKDLRKTTPGKAVGHLFIPFYNFYWIFVSFIWLWQGLNEMGKRYMPGEWINLEPGIPIAFAVLVLLCAVPFVAIGAGVLCILFILQTNGRIKELWEAAKASGEK